MAAPSCSNLSANANCSALELTWGKSPSGTSHSKNLQRGSHPSFTENTNKRLAGIVAFTSSMYDS